MILRFWADKSWQTVHTKIRLLQEEQSETNEEQSDQGQHSLKLCLHFLDALLYGKDT